MSILRTIKKNMARNKAIAQKNLLKRQPGQLELGIANLELGITNPPAPL